MTFDLQRSSEVLNISAIREHNLYETSYLISIDTSYLVPFFRYSTSKFLRFDLDLWHLDVTWGRKYFHYSKAHTWLPIYFLLTLSLDLVPFSRYSTSKFQGFDLKLWPLEVIRDQEYSCYSKSHTFMTSYLTSIDTFSLSRIVVEIYSDNLEDFGGWPWPWTFRCHLK